MAGDEFDVRKNRDFNFNYQVKREFYTDTSDSLTFTWVKRRKDNYDLFNLNEKSVESLDENMGIFTNVLKYRFSRYVKILLDTKITAKKTEVSKKNTTSDNATRSRRDFSSMHAVRASAAWRPRTGFSPGMR